MRDIGVYIHIPFCKRKCNYCDFCSFSGKESDFRAYTDELCRRIRAFASAEKRRAQTVYFGGGTPTLLPVDCFDTIFKTLREGFLIDSDAEITVECNPATVDENYLRALRYMGVNRLSIGLQSANEKELELLGRLHSFEDFCISFDCARRAGFDNISVDLMYGIPEQTPESFERTLRKTLELDPEHISAYGLKIEDGTPFGAMRDLLVLPDEDEEFMMYTTCRQMLEERGYTRYEISNFAKAGRESRHNLRYWELDDYIGFGVAAHSCVDGVRFGNSRDIAAFLRGEDITEERTVISEKERAYERIMLGLRLQNGISIEEYCSYASDGANRIKRFVDAEYLKQSNGRISFTDKGFFVSNAILRELLK